jgi:hypothetical protein
MVHGGLFAALVAGATTGVMGATAGAEPVVSPRMSVVDGRIDVALPAARLQVSTTGARRGNTAFDLSVTGIATDTVGTITIRRTEFTETVQRIPGGAEQSWRFAQAPRGTGDLVLHLDARITAGHSGAVRARSTDDGIMLSGQRLTATYHHGTWIDATGRRWPVTAHLAGNGIELTVPAAVLATTTFPAVLDPKIIVTPINE